MEAFIVLIKLLCAHLCSDFIFQTDAINNGTAAPEVLYSMGTFEYTAWALTITGERAKQIDAD